MTSEVVLEVAGEGGSISLHKQNASAGLRFWLETDEAGMVDDLSEEDQEIIPTGSRFDPVPSFREALEQLDRYPWFRLTPISVHREHRDAILSAVQKRVGLNSSDSTSILERWSAVAGEGMLSVSPPKISDSSLIREVVNQTRTNEWVAARILDAEKRETSPPSRQEFWKQLVLALLSSQQRSTQGSELDLFARREPFPLELEIYEAMTDDKVADVLRSFRFGKRVTEYLRANHKSLFNGEVMWQELCGLTQGLVRQRGDELTMGSSHLEREAAHLVSRLRGIGPKQSRNLLQELGLTRYEIPLDSRVVGWLGENLGWNIPNSDLSDPEVYEFWLDRVQAVCEEAGVLPTIFDAAAFEVGKTMPRRKSSTTRTGYVNKNGQVVVRNTRLPGTDHLQSVYQLGCSQCGYVYGANGSDIFQRKCPACQGGANGIPF